MVYDISITVVFVVFEHAGKVSVKDNGGYTPLHDPVDEGHKKIVELLIAKGAGVNAKDDSQGKTPLNIAILGKQPEPADLLVKPGAKTGEVLKNYNF